MNIAECFMCELMYRDVAELWLLSMKNVVCDVMYSDVTQVSGWPLQNMTVRSVKYHDLAKSWPWTLRLWLFLNASLCSRFYKHDKCRMLEMWRDVYMSQNARWTLRKVANDTWRCVTEHDVTWLRHDVSDEMSVHKLWMTLCNWDMALRDWDMTCQTRCLSISCELEHCGMLCALRVMDHNGLCF